MIPNALLDKLAALDGRLTPAEGRRLADLASRVPIDQAIVEIGSYKGKSACYLAAGSRQGAGALVYAIDLWELHEWPEYSASEVFSAWREQVARLGLTAAITPIRGEAGLLGRLFSLPIGLLFIDGNHAYESVARDFHAWARHLTPGGVVAFHDYANPQHGAGVRKFVDEQLVPPGPWQAGEVIDSMYVAALASALPEWPDGRLTFVSNAELGEHLAHRPPQYGLDLAGIVPRRDPEGVWVDTHRSEYEALVGKYRDARHSAPLEMRLDAICRRCPAGASCRFPRMPPAERREILRSAQRSRWPQWCETKAWGAEIDVVYPFILGAAEGDELRYSLRSLERNLLAVPRVWVVGDKPAWYRGNHIPHQQLPASEHQARFDRAAKLRRVMGDRRIGDEFVWMMDDVYLLQPLTFEELRGRWVRGEMDQAALATYRPRNSWQQEKLLTWQALAQAGRPLDDYTAHLPFVYERYKLKKMFRKYDLARHPYVDTLLYLNEFATVLPRSCEEILYTEYGQASADEIHRNLQAALVMNHAHGGYTPAMQEVLREMFPEPSQFEADS